MTDAMRRPVATSASRFRLRRLYDQRAIDALLSDDRAYSAYALGHLEPSLFERSQFWVAEGPRGSGGVLLANAVGPTVITWGDVDAVAAVLALHPGPRRAYLSTAEPRHMQAIERWHRVTEPLRMQRMSVTRASFHSVEGEAQRLHAADVGAINALYAIDGHSRHSGAQIERAVYFGVYEDGRLASVAGTHVVSPSMSFGIVGNVMTHPAHRGRGLATRVTAAVTAALLERGCGLVVLTVDPDNTPAVRAYRRLGYAPGAAIIEAHLQRRDQLGIGPWLRRRRADHVDGYAWVAAPGPTPDD